MRFAIDPPRSFPNQPVVHELVIGHRIIAGRVDRRVARQRHKTIGLRACWNWSKPPITDSKILRQEIENGNLIARVIPGDSGLVTKTVRVVVGLDKAAHRQWIDSYAVC